MNRWKQKPKPKTMKHIIALLAAIALLSTVAFGQSPTPTPYPVTLLQQPIRIAPLVLAPVDAMAAIQSIVAAKYTVSLNGSTVSVYPPFGSLIVSGDNAGKIQVNLMVRPAAK
jgi:uncharacterized membrane protein